MRLVALISLIALPGLPAAVGVEFNRDVRPILSDRCLACHGPDAGNRKANLRLDVEEAARPKLDAVYRRISSTDKATRMPPAYAGHDALPAGDIAKIKAWIDGGAVWQKHWSFIAPRRAARPSVKLAAWPRNEIDWYVLARLEREGLTPSVEADKPTLLRRVTLDLTGLPPSPVEVEAYLRDDSPGAYERVVDRLLASPRYAERMAVRWLEAARYADTNGYSQDGVRIMWRWRDWVIDAFARNMPFDRFTVEQIAGDMLPGATTDQRVATGFHRNHRTNGEGGIVDEEFRVEYVADRVETTATVWLGLTMGCARCHDHKYDPIKQRDFYSMFAFFNNVLEEKGFVYNYGNEEPFIKAPTTEQQKRLAELNARADQRQREWDAVSEKVELALEKWQAHAPKEWDPIENRVASETLADTRFDGSREVKLGEEKGAFDHRDPYTLTARFKGTRGTILSRMEDYFYGTGWAIYLLDGKLRFHYIHRWTDLGMRVETANPVPLDTWQDVAVTYDGSMKARDGHVKIYLNGVVQPLKILFDQNLSPFTNKAQLRIGGGGGDDLRFRGEISEVRVFDRMLTTAEIEATRGLNEANRLRFAFYERGLPKPLRDIYYRSVTAAAERDAYVETIPTAMVMQEGPSRAAFILKRGAYDAPGEKVTAATPGFLPPLGTAGQPNRLALAQWLVSAENPLTARVTVNRFWQMLFGTGLVKTVEDFGSQGEWPMHPELLDWLAVEFRESGWDVRHTLKTMVMSAAYRQSSRVTPQLLQRDPENRLLACGARLRLPAEMIRDQALAVAGLLHERVGGPSVRPYQPVGLWGELSAGGEYARDRGTGLYRRSLYTFWRRTIAPPSMVTFDSPTREACTVRETRTNTPLQALSLMNDVAYVEAARKLAERMMREGGADRLGRCYLLALGRAPQAKEREALGRLLERMKARYNGDAKSAAELLKVGDAEPDAALDAAELAAYTGVASVLLNLDETVTKQ